MPRRAALLLTTLCAAAAVGLAQAPATEQLDALFAQIERFTAQPQDSLGEGVHPPPEWASVGDEAQRREADTLAGFAARLAAIDTAGLPRQHRISRAVMAHRLADAVDRVRFRMHLIPLDAEGGFYDRIAYALPYLPFAARADYDDYLAWLPAYAEGLRQNLSLLRAGLAEGIVAPAPVIANTLELLGGWNVERPEDSPLYEPLTRLPAGLAEPDREELRRRAGATIAGVNEVYAEIADFIAGDYAAAAPEEPGVGALPGGLAYYDNRVRHYTTLPLTADSVHQLGLAEVARIRAAMDSVIAAVDFAGDFADFLEFLRTDPQFYATSPQQLLDRAAWIAKQAEGRLPAYFAELPSLPFTVAPVPASIAPTYTVGRYVGGSWDRQRPGTYWVNTTDLPSRPLYNLPALTLHEAVPGHHLQIALADELADLPEWRRRTYLSAFGEGWGLYSEYLGEEMGMYTTAYELFGRYTYEMWRACRLVIDSGIHARGWSRQRALDYLAANTALSLHEVRTEVDRYIGWPGQAVSYKVGELEIKRLRREAARALGEGFDLRRFHGVVLRNGAVPLAVLRAEVAAWVAAGGP